MTRIKTYRTFAVALLALIAAAATTPAYAQTFSVLYNFATRSGDANMVGGAFVAQGRDGSLYSTSYAGGAGDSGSVFKITPAGKEMVLYSFCSQTNCSDGNSPLGGLTLRPDGHFVGTTVYNGVGFANGAGTIFDITQTGSLTTLYTFAGGSDGAFPMAAPIVGPDGSFYGTAQNGGNKSNCGTIYKLTGSTFAVVHNFDKLHGCNPLAALVLGADGNLYGTTPQGGTANAGVAFQLQVPTGKAPVFTVLANFEASNPVPFDALVEGNDGNFYGVALSAGVSHEGTLFQVTPAGSFSVVYDFDGTTGTSPFATPVQHTNGPLYGDTLYGGTGSACSGDSGCGVFYSWDAGLPAFVRTVPFLAPVGTFVEILGQGFDSSTTVSFNGTPATATVVSGTYLNATVPAGATTGFVTVTTSSGTLTSNKQFVVTP